ncbi:MAG: cytochrome c3 family protein [Candidatus Rokubacteria bacterium]|nr:cytochrome c3 family protein [Candidatus Rokubacteria bacterium]
MKTPIGAVILLGAFLVTAGGVPALAEPPGTGPAIAQAPKSPGASGSGAAATPHRPGELECLNCHRAKHQGVLQMYVGLGGRGTPMIPSHMFQVRVECVACHTTPKVAEGAAGIVGQTFRPSEQACVDCHGEKYRGMLERWATTLAKMREVVAPKLAAARAALAGADAGNPKHARAVKLVEDAEFNASFVELARGVHNVFYAADLLKLANGWGDEAMTLLGKSRIRTDDALVRGGYCAVLCHEQAGVKQRETGAFGRQKFPHVRHVAEFGATCTSCHSAETHKAVTASAATCASCHHGPQNDRCESCHRAQAGFYRGQTKTPLATVAPNLMAEAVPCTGCHDWSKKHSRQAVGQQCLGCHEPPYMALMSEWTTGFDADARQTADALKAAEAALARARRGGRRTPAADALLREAREALALVRRAGSAHNPLAADALLRAARQKASEALAQAGAR